MHSVGQYRLQRRGRVQPRCHLSGEHSVVTNSILSGNRALAVGGGVYSYAQNRYAYVVLTFTNSTLSGNVATSGGGLYTLTYSAFSAASKVTLTNSTLSGNRASSGDGGGM